MDGILSFLMMGGILVSAYIMIIKFLTDKKKKEFAEQVFRYLSRRYPNTNVVNYGGYDKNMAILSKEAGPFATIEARVVTTKDLRSNSKDEDLLLNAVVDRNKFKSKEGMKHYLSLKSQTQWSKVMEQDIIVGSKILDDRFIIQSDNENFARHFLLDNRDLVQLLVKNYDLEGLDVKWENESVPSIQVRMETVHSGNFLHAFNILFATLNALVNHGHISWGETRSTAFEEKIITIPDTPTYQYRESKVSKEIPVVRETKIKMEEFSTNKASKDIIETEEEPIVLIDLEEVKTLKKPVLKPKELFTSISYQVENIIYEENKIRIIPYTGSMKEIIVTIDSTNANMKGCINNSKGIKLELLLESRGEPRERSWNNPWGDITISGNNHEIIEKLKIRSEIAGRMSSMGTVKIHIESSRNDSLCISLDFDSNKLMMDLAYSVVKDLQFFFDIAIY